MTIETIHQPCVIYIRNNERRSSIVNAYVGIYVYGIVE